jgi:hypothetical protein
VENSDFKPFFASVGRTRFDAHYKVENGIVTVRYGGQQRTLPLGNGAELLVAQSILGDLVKIGPGTGPNT